MGRPSGKRAKDHDERRREILARLTSRLSAPNAMHASYRDLAASSGESVSTLQHYFGKRADILTAVMSESRRSAEGHLAFSRTPDPDDEFADSIWTVANYIRLGFEQFGLGDIHAIGLVEGIRNPAIGPAVVNDLLEPTIEALAARMAIHQQRGQMRREALPRHAAVFLIGPILLIMLHQKELGGRHSHPADMDRFFKDHVEAFIRAHETQGPSL